MTRLSDYDTSRTSEALVKESHRITSKDTPEVRSILLSVSHPDFSYREGQNIGITVPGAQAFGHEQHFRLYTIASVEQIELVLDDIEPVADGRTVIPGTVNLLNSRGELATQVDIISIHVRAASILEEDADPGNPQTGVSGDNLGYVIYTSGSTGKPKGVMIEHRNAAALIAWPATRCRR